MNRFFLASQAVLIATLGGVTAQAQTALFSPTEIRQHQERIQIITSTAADCLSETYADHVQFFKKWKVSKYYGNRKPEHRTAEGRRAALVRYGAPASLESELEPTSCIGLTMQCLAAGFKAAGQSATWSKIHAQLAVDNKFYGTDLQKMLRQLGWKTLYWNPDVSQNAAWDQEDQTINPLQPGKTWNPVWGGHAYRYAMVTRKNDYYGIPIDDARTLVNFKTSVPQSFKRVPFFVGTAHAGYHVFPGSQGQVIEAHSMRNLNAFDNLEVSAFNPLAPQGGPRWTRTEKYRSGVIVVPPGF
ncbi:MAG: hypothetical protein KF789_12985 [Bdellovibrionaceae bacterium]|nr:hypothetical protein [Pseudobdellovibrionaceae bacterium]